MGYGVTLLRFGYVLFGYLLFAITWAAKCKQPSPSVQTPSCMRASCFGIRSASGGAQVERAWKHALNVVLSSLLLPLLEALCQSGVVHAQKGFHKVLLVNSV